MAKKSNIDVDNVEVEIFFNYIKEISDTVIAVFADYYFVIDNGLAN